MQLPFLATEILFLLAGISSKGHAMPTTTEAHKAYIDFGLCKLGSGLPLQQEVLHADEVCIYAMILWFRAPSSETGKSIVHAGPGPMSRACLRRSAPAPTTTAVREPLQSRACSTTEKACLSSLEGPPFRLRAISFTTGHVFTFRPL